MSNLFKAKVTIDETPEALIQRTVAAVVNRTHKLTVQKDNALSAFRNAANQLAIVNEGLATTAKVSKDMVTLFTSYQEDAEQAIQDNDAVRAKILDIIGE